MTKRFSIRSHMFQDKDFVYNSWNKGLRHSNETLELIPLETYNSQFQKVFDLLWKNPNVKINIACLPQDPEVILGYSIFEKQTIHWVFVKMAWRGFGIARSLVPQDINTCTNLSKAGKALATKYNIKYNPIGTL